MRVRLFPSSHLYSGISAALCIQAVYLQGLTHRMLTPLLHSDPGIRQDRTLCLKLAFFWQLGYLPASFADLKMKGTEREPPGEMT